MKKRVLALTLLSLIFLSVFVIANETLVEESEVKDIQEKIDQIPLDPETGEFDPNKLNKSIAEERVEKINSWISENAEWLKIVFCMVPEISWLFAFVIYIWILFFMVFILNRKIFQLLSPIGRSTQANAISWIAGIGIFAISVALKIIFYIGEFFYNLWIIVWNYVLPIGIIASVIGIVVLIVVLVMFPSLILVLIRTMKAKKEAKAKEIEKEDRENLHTFTEEAFR
ncbi:MAG: hypothetical protein WC494_00065 [Candidatus Pacearchaeota archaeon]